MLVFQVQVGYCARLNTQIARSQNDPKNTLLTS